MNHRKLLFIVLIALVAALPCGAQDLLKVDSALAEFSPGEVVTLNVYLGDASGTLLGTDRGVGNTIQGISMTLQVDPVSWVTALDLQPAGIADGLTERFQTQRIDNGNQLTWLIAFDEVSAPLTPTLDGLDVFGKLKVTLSSSVPPNGVISLALIPETAGISNTRSSLFVPGTANQLQLISGVIASNLIFEDGFESGDVSAWSRVQLP